MSKKNTIVSTKLKNLLNVICVLYSTLDQIDKISMSDENINEFNLVLDSIIHQFKYILKQEKKYLKQIKNIKDINEIRKDRS